MPLQIAIWSNKAHNVSKQDPEYCPSIQNLCLFQILSVPSTFLKTRFLVEDFIVLMYAWKFKKLNYVENVFLLETWVIVDQK